MADGPYAWRSARSKSGRNSSSDEIVDEMAAEGRRPALNAQGQVRGFRSRPGAPLSDRDSMSGLGIVGDIGSSTRSASWDQFFRRPVIPATGAGKIPPTGLDELAPVSSGDYMGADLSALPVTPAANIAATIAGTTSWMTKQGLPVPPPPNPVTGAITPVVPPVANGWNTTGPEQVNRIARRYAPPNPVVKNPWGKPIPRI